MKTKLMNIATPLLLVALALTAAAAPVQAGPGDVDFATPTGLMVGASAQSDTESGASSAGFGMASCVLNGLYQYEIGPPVWSCAGAAGIGGEACFEVLWSDFCVSAGGATGSAFAVGVAGPDGACATASKVVASDAKAEQDNDSGAGFLPNSIPVCLAIVGAVGTGVCAEFSAEAGAESLGGSSSADGEGATAACPDTGGGCNTSTDCNDYCDHYQNYLKLECIVDVGGGFIQTSNSDHAPIGSGCYDSWQIGAEKIRLTEVLAPDQQTELLSNLKSSLLENLRANKPILEAPLMLEADDTSIQRGQAAIDAMWLDFEPAVESIVDEAVLDEVFGYMISCE